jgi:hypothetical protein
LATWIVNPGQPAAMICAAMAVRILISYDGTAHDDDALMLARMLRAAGAELSLAFVRHSREYDPRREEIAEHDAAHRMQQGVDWLGEPTVPTHIVVNPSTGAGLAALAAAEPSDLVLFGSDYRTPPGRVEPGVSAQGLLDGGSVAIGVAAAGLRTAREMRLAIVSIAGPDDSGAAAQTARSLAEATGAELVPGGRDADVIVVDSQVNAPEGRVALDGTTRGRLDSARGSVLVVPRGVALSF